MRVTIMLTTTRVEQQPPKTLNRCENRPGRMLEGAEAFGQIEIYLTKRSSNSLNALRES